jgi:hypothetical protein
MAPVGRNDPCPCGSGKKYKKCCLAKETAVDLESYRANKAEENLRGEILRFATGGRFRDEILEAFQIYGGGKVDPSMLMNQDPLENIRFLDWFVNEHRHTTENKRIIDLFEDLRAKSLDDDQKKLLEEWKASCLGAFEVESAEGGTVTLTNVFEEKTYSVEDESACEELEAGMVIVARVTSSWGKQALGGAPVLLQKDAKEKFIEAVKADFEDYKEEHADAEMSAFLSENTHLLISAAQGLA